jgi:predicted nucleic acid-binding protein
MVVDASVAVRWVVPEAGSELAIGLLGRDLGHSIYDCFHLAAALLRDTALVTADR